MGIIGENRSKETGNHVKRVAEYSYFLAKGVGLSEDDAQSLKLASPMHDIGKVASPDAILKKPARFTPEEFEIMKTHAQLGYEMLKMSHRPILHTASIVAYEHHEKYDGTGYPRGISGENIHIYGRITAIADVFDALTTERPYRKALSLEETLSIIEKDTGKAFYPEVVEAGIKVLEGVGVLDIFRGSLLTEDLESFRKEAFFTDVITGLLTFSRWKERLSSLQDRNDIVYVAFDIKGLLLINLTKGWEKGDEILGDIGHELLKSGIGSFCRFAGGTFLGVISKKELSKVQKIINTVSSRNHITIYEAVVEDVDNKSIEEIVAVLVKKLRERKKFFSSKGGIEKLLRGKWRRGF